MSSQESNVKSNLSSSSALFHPSRGYMHFSSASVPIDIEPGTKSYNIHMEAPVVGEDLFLSTVRVVVHERLAQGHRSFDVYDFLEKVPDRHERSMVQAIALLDKNLPIALREEGYMICRVLDRYPPLYNVDKWHPDVDMEDWSQRDKMDI